MNQTIEVNETDAALVVKVLVPKFDLDRTRQMQQELAGIGPATDMRPLLLDLSVVEFLPSATLDALVELANRCRTNDRRLGLVRLKPKVHELLKLCALDQVFAIYADEDEALIPR